MPHRVASLTRSDWGAAGVESGGVGEGLSRPCVGGRCWSGPASSLRAAGRICSLPLAVSGRPSAARAEAPGAVSHLPWGLDLSVRPGWRPSIAAVPQMGRWAASGILGCPEGRGR